MGKRKADDNDNVSVAAKAAARAARPKCKAKAKAKGDVALPAVSDKEKAANKQFWEGFKKVKQEHDVVEKDPLLVNSSQSSSGAGEVCVVEAEPVGTTGVSLEAKCF